MSACRLSSRQLLAFCACTLAAVGCSVDKIPTNGSDTPSEGKIGLFEPHSTPDAGPPPPCMCGRPGTTGTATGAGGNAGSAGGAAAGGGGNNALAAIAGIGLPSPDLLPAQDVIGGIGGGGASASGVSGSAGPPAAAGGMSGNPAAVSGTGGVAAGVPGAGEGGADAPSGCTMSVNFTTVPSPTLVGEGRYDHGGPQRSYAVVWIETPDGVLVKTLGLWCQTLWIFANLKRYWTQNPSCCQPDVVAMPTMVLHPPETVTWDCKDLNMHTVPDGDYVLLVEADVDEAHLLPAFSVNFTKGSTPWTLNPPPEPPQTAMSITYTPN
jgi:hypothetical protein